MDSPKQQAPSAQEAQPNTQQAGPDQAQAAQQVEAAQGAQPGQGAPLKAKPQLKRITFELLILAAILWSVLPVRLTSPSATGTAWQIIANLAAILLILALLIQRYRFGVGTWMIVGALVLIAVTGLGQYVLPIYGLVCWQAWLLAKNLQRYRPWVLAGMILASVSGMFVLFFRFIGATEVKELLADPERNIAGALAVGAVLCVVSIGFFWLLGNNARRKHLRLADLQARAELAALSERSRIAREMHDIVAHSLTAVIAQADGGCFAAKQHPELAQEALSTIGQEARRALDQMRSLLSVLHEDERSQDIAPGSEQISQLLRESQRNGLRIDFQETSQPGQLSEAQSLTVYRIVQECITNTLKHAGAVDATLAIDWGQQITITMDNAPGQGLDGLPKDFGRGLIGIRERARIHGGDAQWGASTRYPGGWKVQAWIMR
ncbi:sensor histidine kinase [Corynebacterium pseudopelargi]|nr:histidine kinase [Corynebacterium pseudopelargi]